MEGHSIEVLIAGELHTCWRTLDRINREADLEGLALGLRLELGLVDGEGDGLAGDLSRLDRSLGGAYLEGVLELSLIEGGLERDDDVLRLRARQTYRDRSTQLALNPIGAVLEGMGQGRGGVAVALQIDAGGVVALHELLDRLAVLGAGGEGCREGQGCTRSHRPVLDILVHSCQLA